MTTTFHAALADTLSARGITQRALADAVGVRQNTVSRWCKDETPEPARVFQIEDALGVEPGALSHHLGYMPVGSDRVPCTIIDAVRDADELEPFHRKALLDVYRSFVGSSPTA